MNANRIFTEGFSNPATSGLYHKRAPLDGRIQCGGCSFYAVFNSDWGLCCYRKSRFHLETVFEHFGCERHVSESWESHSFQENSHLLIDRSCLMRLLRLCANTIGGRKGRTGVVSRKARLLYHEIENLLALHDSAKKPAQGAQSQESVAGANIPC